MKNEKKVILSEYCLSNEYQNTVEKLKKEFFTKMYNISVQNKCYSYAFSYKKENVKNTKNMLKITFVAKIVNYENNDLTTTMKLLTKLHKTPLSFINNIIEEGELIKINKCHKKRRK